MDQSHIWPACRQVTWFGKSEIRSLYSFWNAGMLDTTKEAIEISCVIQKKIISCQDVEQNCVAGLPRAYQNL